MRRLSIFSLALLGLATVHAEAKPRHVAAQVGRDLASAMAEEVVADLLAGAVHAAVSHNGVVLNARQSNFYANENFYTDNRNWGY